MLFIFLEGWALDRYKVIKYFLITAVVLLVANIAVDFFVGKQVDEEDINSGYINKRFEVILKEFGIDSSWISKKDIKQKTTDSLDFIYKIKVPPDLPIPVLLNQINTELNDLHLTITSKEKNINGPTQCRILYKNSLMLMADIDIDLDLRRKSSSIGFIINNIEDLSDEEFTKLLEYPEYFAFILTPTKKAEEYKKRILDHDKEYILMLNDDIDEPDYKMEEDFSKARLKSAVRSIIGTFSDTKLFVIDDQSDLHKSSLNAFLESEFKKRKLDLVSSSRFVWLTGSDEQDLQSRFRYLCRSLASGGSRIFTLRADDFYDLSTDIDNLRKKGYKFILPSSVNFGLQEAERQGN